MGDMLDEFVDLFATPTMLPPVRSHDHHIRLLPDTVPVAIQPYSYGQLQKDKLERQSTEMLAQGIILPSNLAFSSPVLLVKKRDDSWRLCVDYWILNNHTVKDTFRIPVIMFFTKLDIRSGYLQVGMNPC